MDEYIEIAGSGSLRSATPSDVTRALEVRATTVRPRPRALTASAMKMDARDSEYRRRMSLTWQRRALEYITLIPELNYASRFYARMLKQLRIFPATLDELGKKTPIESGLPVQLLDRIQDPSGGRSQLLGNYGRLMFVTGEGQLFGRDLNTEFERWAFVWSDELKVTPEGIVWYPFGEGKTPIEYSHEQAITYRLWQPSPIRSGEADSPMRAGLEVAEELLKLTAAVRATAVTRTINGMLVLPSELSFGSLEGYGDEDPENNPFLADLNEHFEGAVENAGSAEAAKPFILEVANEFASSVRWMALHDPATDYMERELRKEAVERLARGFDFPPEVLLGLSDSNHWAARQILDDMWKSHGAPIAEQFCDDLNEAYLRPSLLEEGYEDWQRVVIGYDETDVVVRPDRGQSAIDAWNVGAVGWETVRRANGFSEDDAMTDEEKEVWAAIKLRIPEILPPDIAPPLRGPTAQQNGNQPADQGPPEPGPEGVSRPESRTASIMGAAEMALRRCRELAGSRIRSHHKECPDCLKPAEDQPNSLVASLIGPQNLILAGESNPESLVRGGSTEFRAQLVDWGLATEQAEALGQMVEVYASKTLFERKPTLPSGFAAHVERVKDLAVVAK